MLRNQDAFIPTRHSLLSRLKDWDDQESWRDFFNTYWKLIYGTAIKAGLTHTEAEEVVQETVITISKRIKDFKYDPAVGSFKGWLLHTTRWKITDQLRKRQRSARRRNAVSDNEGESAAIDKIPDDSDLTSAWEEEWQKNLVDAAIERVKRRVDAEKYQIFDLYVIKNWPVSRVASALGVSKAEVYLTKHRVSALIRKEVKELEIKFV